jgi:thioredoxin 1
MWMVFQCIGSMIRRAVFGKEKPAGPAEKKAVVECETEEAFAEALKEAKEAKRAVVIDFTASWCGPCKRIAPVFADMSEEYDATFLKVDVDKNSEVSGAHNVTAMPTFAFYDANGEKVDEQIRGANIAKITDMLDKLGVKKVVKEVKKDA